MLQHLSKNYLIINSTHSKTVGDIHKANLDQDESSALNEPTKQDIVETLECYHLNNHWKN